uniref:Uncharacterized protein n=1 Tax=Glossina palpalis gambiensis TaxID=67801 RepID=A0A1B0ASA0_9MUSC
MNETKNTTRNKAEVTNAAQLTHNSINSNCQNTWEEEIKIGKRETLIELDCCCCSATKNRLIELNFDFKLHLMAFMGFCVVAKCSLDENQPLKRKQTVMIYLYRHVNEFIKLKMNEKERKRKNLTLYPRV